MTLPELPSDLSPDNRYVSTAQVSKALGVSVTTVKRWVDENILPAHKTAGGHRKLLMADVIRLVRETNLPQADLTRLIPRPRNVDLGEPDDVLEQLVLAFAEPDADLIRILLHGAYFRGYSLETLADRVLSPAMIRVGHDWESGRIGVLQEHRITQAVVSAMYELKTHLHNRGQKERPIAVGGAPEHDHYVLPTMLAGMCLLDVGWEAINLGPHTPMSAFRAALDEFNPQLVWMSVSHLSDPEGFLSEYRSFYKEAEDRGIFVAVGGRGLHDDIRSKMLYTTFGDGFSQLISFARQIYRLPGRPKRGRPPRDAKVESVEPSVEPSDADPEPN